MTKLEAIREINENDCIYGGRVGMKATLILHPDGRIFIKSSTEKTFILNKSDFRNNYTHLPHLNLTNWLKINQNNILKKCENKD